MILAGISIGQGSLQMVNLTLIGSASILNSGIHTQVALRRRTGCLGMQVFGSFRLPCGNNVSEGRPAFPGRRSGRCLGLSTQVPGTYLDLSSGPNREYDFAGRTLQFQSTKQREAIFKYPESALAVQALRALGEKRITPEILTRLRRYFTPSQWQKIQKDTTVAFQSSLP